MSTLPITLEFLLVSNNYHTLTAISEAAKHFGANLGFVPTAELADEYLQRRKVDALFVDTEICGVRALVSSLRQGTSNRTAVVFACLSGAGAAPFAIGTGPTCLLQTPLTTESVIASLNTARESMTRERRRYFRHPATVPVSLGEGEAVQRATMTNLSEGGMAVHMQKPLEHRSIVDFTFVLSPSGTISGKGLVAWVNKEGMMGLQFQVLRGDGATRLEQWLSNRKEVPGLIDPRYMPRPTGKPREC